MKPWKDAKLENLAFLETQRVKGQIYNTAYTHIHKSSCELQINPEKGICTCGAFNLDS